MRALVRRQVDAGVDFVVPGGTTGEAATLTMAEQARLTRIAVEASEGALPVIAGCGGNATARVAALAQALERAGASGLLCVTPYYNKPTPQGLALHYATVAAATDLPVIVYNVPGRTGVDATPERLARLAEIPGVAGVKEASGDVARIGRVLRAVPSDFGVLAGDDAIALPAMALGGSGVVSVAANQIPREMAQLVAYCLEGDFRRARILHRRWLPLMDVNFCESNPGPVKFALARMGLLEPWYRPPMTAISKESERKVASVLDELGLPRAPRVGRPVSEAD